jgi:phage recombination protein Bet
MTTPSTALEKSLGVVLSEEVLRRSINEATWNALTNSVFPGAKPESVLLAWDYCEARHLDPLKKPVHIVPMEVKNAKTGQFEWRDVILPGIFELRTTAFRTDLYRGHTKHEFGVIVDYKGVKAPEWCAMTFFRHHAASNTMSEFPVIVFFSECVAMTREGRVNSRWTKAPKQMLMKCTEAAGLREVCPEEIGGMYTDDEIAGQRAIDAPVPFDDVVDVEPPAKPEGYDKWREETLKVADEGTELLREAWRNAPVVCRNYMKDAEPASIDLLKERAVLADAKKRDAPPSSPAPGGDEG